MTGAIGRAARGAATVTLVLTSIVVLPLALSGEASAMTIVPDSGCRASALYTREGAAEEIGNGIGDQKPVGVKGYCSGGGYYRIQITCGGNTSQVQGPRVRSGYSTAYCPKGKRADSAYIFRTK